MQKSLINRLGDEICENLLIDYNVKLKSISSKWSNTVIQLYEISKGSKVDRTSL